MIKKVIKQKGFTLIELLVVISIISLLSSVILGSIKTARDKATDAAIKEQLIALRNQAELYRSNHENYGDLTSSVANFTGYHYFSDPLGPTGYSENHCAGGLYVQDSGSLEPVVFNDPSVISAAEKVYDLSGSIQCSLMGDSVSVGQSEVITTWGFATRLKSNPLKGWCVDSSGASKEVDYPTASNIQAIESGEWDLALGATGLCLDN